MRKFKYIFFQIPEIFLFLGQKLDDEKNTQL